MGKQLFDFANFKKELEVIRIETKMYIVKRIFVFEKKQGNLLPSKFKNCFFNKTYVISSEISKIGDDFLSYDIEFGAFIFSIMSNKDDFETINTTHILFIENLLQSNLYKAFLKSHLITDYEFLYKPIKNNDFKNSNVYRTYLNKFVVPPKLFEFLNVSNEIVQNFDVELLIQFVCASFSGSYRFVINNDNKIDLLIEVKSTSTFTFERKLFSTKKKVTFREFIDATYKPSFENDFPFDNYENFIKNQVTCLNQILRNNCEYIIVFPVSRNLNDLSKVVINNLLGIFIQEQLSLACIIKTEPHEAIIIYDRQKHRIRLFKKNFKSIFSKL